MRRGFTLLEVMISLAILAVGLVALSDLNGGAVTMQAYARRATQATLLLRGKMADVEETLQKDGFSDFTDDKHGSFEDDEGGAGYQWRAEIIKPDVQMDASQLLGLLGVGGQQQGSSGGSSSSSSATSLTSGLNAAAQLTGGGSQGAVAGLSAPGSPLAGMLQGQATNFLETLKKSVRELRVTVSWKDGSQERSISASQHIVILPDMVGKAVPASQMPTVTPLPGSLGVPSK